MRCLLAAGLLGLICPVTYRTAAAETVNEPIISDQRTFRIPFALDASEAASLEVRLYASHNEGKTWKLAASASHDDENFAFRAEEDGEYWFAVRTVDAAGRASPDEPRTAEMRVIVDTTPPRLELHVDRTADGEAVARWRVEDRGATGEPPQLSYRFGPADAWHAVQPTQTKRQGDAAGSAGETAWPIAASEAAAYGDAPLTVRAEVADAAGNRTQREITASDGRALPATPATAESASSTARRDPNRPLLVNSPSFELDYEVDGTAAGALEQVEIWGTRDEGRTWVSLGVDEDRRSPCAVTVDREGTYGFAVVLTAVGGASGSRPSDGDRPAIHVGVDLTPPKVRFTTAEPDAEGRPCTLDVHWLAQDEHLGPQAVSLAYSAAPQGPWLPLAVGIANTGSVSCRFDPSGPDAAYLRIEVRDEAGNLGATSTTVPIPIEKREMHVRFVGNENKAPGARPKWFHVLR